jgi:hypothetical protein
MTTLDLDDEFAPVTRLHPGDFERHPHNGAPYVTHPTDTARGQGNKPELIEQCNAAGIVLPQKITVDILKDLLRRPKRVQYGRPSGLGKQVENTINLQKWSERMEALGLATDPDLYEEAKQLLDLDRDGDEFKQLADSIAVKAKRVAQAQLAADRGTHHHGLTEDYDNDRDPVARMEAGELLGVPRHVQHALLQAWALMLDTYDIEILATEATCVDDVWCQAGTLDRVGHLRRDLRFVLPDGEIVTLPAGLVPILDIKTGQLRLDDSGRLVYWQSYAVQLASYAQSRPYNTQTGERGEWGFDIDQKWAIIAHLDILSALEGNAVCRLILVDLEAGRHAGNLCVAARVWEKRRDVFSVPSDDLAVTVPVHMPTEPEIEPAPESATATRRHWLVARIDVVKERGHGRELIAVWPQGVPGTATDHQHTDAELDLIHQAVDLIEKRHQLPLNPDPASVARKVEAVLEARRERLTIVQPSTPAFDEGGTLTGDEFADLQQFTADAAIEHRGLVEAWLAEAIKGGVGFSAARIQSTRRRAIIQAAFALAALCDGLESEADLAVAALQLGTGLDRVGGAPVGVTLGQLTESQATAVIAAARQAPNLALSYDSGEPRFVDQIAS